MSESNSTPTGRVRRRASRQAGAPTDAVAVERAESAPAGDTVKLGTAGSGPAADSTVKSAGADETVKLSTASPASGAVSDSTGKLSTAADDDKTVRLTDSPEEAAAADASADTSEPAKRSLGPLGWAAAVVAVLSLTLLVGSGGFFAYHQHQVSTQ